MTITRRHDTPDGYRTATYSDCETYRYALTAEWNPDGARLLYVMLNPSKATERANDPTIERCERRARALGYGALQVVNLFALRETSPLRLKRAKQPEGPDNARFLSDGAAWATDILAAWGVHGTHLDQGHKAALILRGSGKPLLTLGLTKHGLPRHPLYVSYTTKPRHWDTPETLAKVVS